MKKTETEGLLARLCEKQRKKIQELTDEKELFLSSISAAYDVLSHWDAGLELPFDFTASTIRVLKDILNKNDKKGGANNVNNSVRKQG